MNEQLKRERQAEQYQQLAQQSALAQQHQNNPQQMTEYNYYQKISHPLVEGMTEGEGVQIEQAAAPAQIQNEGYFARKKRESREKKMHEAREKVRQSLQNESLIGEEREKMYLNQTQDVDGLSDERVLEYKKNEKKLLASKLEAIKLNKSASAEALEAENKFSDKTKRELEWSAQADIAKAYGDYARSLPIGSEERKKAMAEKEKQELKADKLRRLFKVTLIENQAEREREESTIARHAKFDFLKGIFQRENPLTHEDAVWEHDGKKLINVGRAFFGGTKPMYIFEDRNAPIMGVGNKIAGYKQYLFKTAVNCIGIDKPQGALVTEAASKLQKIMCGENSIPAFAAIQGNRVLGSFQEKKEPVTGNGALNLFSWQANPEQDLPAQAKTELLREHALDWLLCNFDTKGENFLNNRNGTITSFDKEASFGKITKEEARHMSSTYKPHSNDTIYNVLFTQFAEGKLDLDLKSTETNLDKIEDMPREQYLGMFKDMLTEKYGPAGEKNTERQRVEELMWERKDNLREEYRRFYGELLKRRREVQTAEGKPHDHLEEMPEESEFKFEHDEARVNELAERERLRTSTVPNVTPEQLAQHGGASFTQLRTKEEAERIVAQSGGFMYMKPAHHGTYQLCPTMPETALIEGKEIKLRRSYNQFIKMIFKMAIGEDGKPKPDAAFILSDLKGEIIDFFRGDKMSEKKEKMIDERIEGFFEQFKKDKTIFGENPQEGMEDFKAFIKSMYVLKNGNIEHNALLFSECSDIWTESFERQIRVKIPLEERLEQVKTAMQAAKATEQQIQEKLGAVKKMYEDARIALEEMRELRELDVDSPDVALVNACSANSDTLTRIIGLTKGEHRLYDNKNKLDGTIQIVTQDRISKNPRETFDWIDAHIVNNGNVNAGVMEKYNREKSEFNSKGVITRDTAIFLEGMCGNGLKYSYHKACVIGEEGGETFTFETFAPETSQLTVTPYTRHIAVGCYKQGEQGMEQFYLHDNPFADETGLTCAKTKEEILKGKLPGDRQ